MHHLSHGFTQNQAKSVAIPIHNSTRIVLPLPHSHKHSRKAWFCFKFLTNFIDSNSSRLFSYASFCTRSQLFNILLKDFTFSAVSFDFPSSRFFIIFLESTKNVLQVLFSGTPCIQWFQKQTIKSEWTGILMYEVMGSCCYVVIFISGTSYLQGNQKEKRFIIKERMAFDGIL